MTNLTSEIMVMGTRSQAEEQSLLHVQDLEIANRELPRLIQGHPLPFRDLPRKGDNRFPELFFVIRK